MAPSRHEIGVAVFVVHAGTSDDGVEVLEG
jgi:hypothetical protein